MRTLVRGPHGVFIALQDTSALAVYTDHARALQGSLDRPNFLHEGSEVPTAKMAFLRNYSW